jgi:hypothetical protein
LIGIPKQRLPGNAWQEKNQSPSYQGPGRSKSGGHLAKIITQMSTASGMA